ncbi:MAG: outer membrane protein assembly factor BamD [Spirosomataceae bacterium]
MQKLRFFGWFIAGWLLVSSCSKFSKLQKSGTDDQKYQAAMDYFKKKDFYKAGLLFEELIPILKGSEQQELASYYFAYCQYHQGQYSLANFYFKKFYDTFARSEHAPEAAYMAAYSLYKDSPKHNLDQTSTITAIDALQTFLNTFPDTEHREECTNNIKELRKKLETKAYEKAKLYFQTKDYDMSRLKSAVIAFSNFQLDYPDSDYNEEIAFMQVQAGYEYAKLSFEEKQKERFDETVGYYQSFVDKYPNSKYIKQAEKLYEDSVKESARLAALKEKKEEEKKNNANKVGAGNQQ